MLPLEDKPDRAQHLRFLHDHDLVHVALGQLEGELSRRRRGQPVGDGVDAFEGHDPPCLQRAVHAVGARRLGSDHLHVRPLLLQVERDAADQAAAADRHQDGVNVLEVAQQLDGDGALAGDDVGVVEGMHEGGATLFLVANGLEICVVVVAAGRHDLCTEAADRLDLELVGGLGDVDGGGDLEGRRRVGDALAVISG